MNFALIICTYMRPKALSQLLVSLDKQTLMPKEILIIDGSKDHKTQMVCKEQQIDNLNYFKVKEDDRGLTRQRNFGLSKLSEHIDIVCFLDDDTILDPGYFENLIGTYDLYPNALGVGGYITNEVEWKESDTINSSNCFYYDNWMREEPLRFRVRSWFSLAPDSPPCYLPSFSHGRSVSFLPPSKKIYPVELFMGGVSSYRREVFEKLSFSTYFEGYGLYEDADFCLRLSKIGQLYVNTAAQLEHHHEPLGRPNKFKYGEMVLRNGWYIWRVKYKNPKYTARLKWHMTALLLILLTVCSANIKTSYIEEGLGRLYGWISIVLNPPSSKIDNDLSVNI